MKIYLSKINESWIVDRFREDWYKYNQDISSKKIYKADTIWIISPWVWKKIPKRHLEKKNVVCSIYHIDFDSFNNEEQKDFEDRDKYVDFYHVISKNTKKQLEKITDKKIINSNQENVNQVIELFSAEGKTIESVGYENVKPVQDSTLLKIIDNVPIQVSAMLKNLDLSVDFPNDKNDHEKLDFIVQKELYL